MVAALQAEMNDSSKLLRLSLHDVLSAERRRRISDDPDHARWQRCERRGERCAVTALGICSNTPLAREHHSDEHLEPLHADATVKLPTAAFVAVLRACRGVCACVRVSA
jgi:hypothetical protein